MLGEILKTLEQHKGNLISEVPNKVSNKLQKLYPGVTESGWEVYAQIEENPRLTISRIAEVLSISDRLVKKNLSVLKEKGLIVRIGGNKTGYWKIRS